MTEVSPLILYEDKNMIVIRKPPGVAVQHKNAGTMDLYSLLLNYPAEKEVDHGIKAGGGRTRERIPYLAIVHRLDQPVEGVMVFAKNRKAAASLSAQVQDGSMKKEYLALVRQLRENSGQEKEENLWMPEDECRKKEAWHDLTDDLLRDGKTNTSRIVPKGTSGSKEARLSYRVLGSNVQTAGTQGTLLHVRLFTGRHHQIRVQLSGAGMPIIGDRKYGTMQGQKCPGGGADIQAGSFLGTGLPLCLAAFRITFRHPVSGELMKFEAVPEFLKGCDFRLEG